MSRWFGLRRCWVLVQWIRRRRPPGVAFGHRGEDAIIIWVAIALSVLEGAVVEVVLVAILGHSFWVWLALGVHVYGVFYLLSMYAAMVTRPHTVDDDVVHLRSGVTTEVVLPRQAIRAAVVGRFPDFDRSRWRGVDDGGPVSIASGEASLRLDLAPDAEMTVNGREVDVPPTTVYLSVDEPRRFRAALDTADAERSGQVLAPRAVTGQTS